MVRTVLGIIALCVVVIAFLLPVVTVHVLLVDNDVVLFKDLFYVWIVLGRASLIVNGVLHMGIGVLVLVGLKHALGGKRFNDVVKLVQHFCLGVVGVWISLYILPGIYDVVILLVDGVPVGLLSSMVAKLVLGETVVIIYSLSDIRSMVDYYHG